MPAPVVFLDKDGTLIEDMPYNADPSLIRLLPGVAEALMALHASGWRLAVVTNQSGVARGLFPESALVGVETRLRELLGELGVPLAGFFYCPHHPNGIVPHYSIPCECRKPAPGLILTAAKQLGIDPQDCWMIGDQATDIEAGRKAGCQTVQICTVETPCALPLGLSPDPRVPDFLGAVTLIGRVEN